MTVVETPALSEVSFILGVEGDGDLLGRAGCGGPFDDAYEEGRVRDTDRVRRRYLAVRRSYRREGPVEWAWVSVLELKEGG